jgi:hypothetical protein
MLSIASQPPSHLSPSMLEALQYPSCTSNENVNTLYNSEMILYLL